MIRNNMHPSQEAAEECSLSKQQHKQSSKNQMREPVAELWRKSPLPFSGVQATGPWHNSEEKSLDRIPRAGLEHKK